MTSSPSHRHAGHTGHDHSHAPAQGRASAETGSRTGSGGSWLLQSALSRLGVALLLCGLVLVVMVWAMAQQG